MRKERKCKEDRSGILEPIYVPCPEPRHEDFSGFTLEADAGAESGNRPTETLTQDSTTD